MRTRKVLVLLGVAASGASAADLPRGVGPEFASFYNPSSGSFECISNPSVLLSYTQVNDDYCDCPDGSDEPGTSACAHLSSLSPAVGSDNVPGSAINTTPALPGFYCANKGHIPSYIPFINVNDGICDHSVCCDGSDEYAHVGGVKCDNKCQEIGKEWKKQDAARQKSLGAAQKRRQELVVAAERKKQEVSTEIRNLATQIQAAQVKIKQLEKEKDQVERDEKKKALRAGDSTGSAAALAVLTKAKLEEMRNLCIKLRDQKDKNAETASELEEIIRNLKTEYNPNFNDPGVKRAVQMYEHYEAMKEDEEIEPDPSYDVQSMELLDGNYGIPWEDFEKPESDTSILYNLAAYLPESLRTLVFDKLADFRSFLIAQSILPPLEGNINAENKAVKQARERLEAEVRTLESDKSKKKEHEDDLTKDYGKDDVFRTLKGTSVSLDVGEYTYELVWLDTVKQKPINHGMSQNMGNFEGFETVFVDEPTTPDGKGLGTGERVILKYTNGNGCWNGPQRSTTVVLGCAEKEEIWKVTEEEKCVYRMEVGTPAACDPAPAAGGNTSREGGGAAKAGSGTHDEL